MSKGRLWLGLMLYLFAVWGQAASIDLTAAQQEYGLGTHLEWLRDPKGTLALEQVQQEDPSRWVQSESTVPNLGYSDDTVWFRVGLHNRNAGERWYLAINYPLIRDLTVYFLRDGELDELYQTGDQFEFAARPVLHRDFIFPLTIPRNQLLDIYIRVSSPYSIQMPLQLFDEHKMVEHDSLVAVAHGLFFGFVVVMSVYNFFLFLGTGQRSYLFYVLFSVAIGGFQLVQQGLAFQILWPKEVMVQNRATGLFLHFSLLCCFLFVTDFLALNKNGSLIYRLFQALAWCAGLMLIVSPLVSEHWVLRIGVYLSVPACLLSILASWNSWRKGSEDAGVFAVAWGIFLFGVLLLALNKMGVFPRNFLTEHGAELGTVIELSLLALALAGRINRERAKRVALEQHARELERAALLANERALELERLNNEHLERSVRERTEDLHRALSELSDMNRKLEQLSTHDPITGLENENSFLRALSQEWERAYRTGEMVSLLVVELDRYREILADYGQVAADECLKNLADILVRTVSRPADVVARYGDKVFGVLLPGTEITGAGHLAEKVAMQVSEKPFDFGICQLTASVSIGIASDRPVRIDQFKDLLLSAESAVYVAKNNGGNQIQLAKLHETD